MADNKTQENACDVVGVKRRLESSKDLNVSSKVRRLSDDQEASSSSAEMNEHFVKCEQNSNIGQESLEEEDTELNAIISAQTENRKKLNAEILKRQQHEDAMSQVSNLNSFSLSCQHQQQPTISRSSQQLALHLGLNPGLHQIADYPPHLGEGNSTLQLQRRQLDSNLNPLQQPTIPNWYAPNASNYMYFPSRNSFQHSPHTYNFWLPNQVTSRNVTIVRRDVIYNCGNFVVHDFESIAYYNERHIVSNYNPYLN